MADQNINVRIKHKYDTEANWSSKNPVLLQGEIGFINDGRYKVGNGTSKWNDLQYATADSLVRHVPGEGFEYGYAYSKTITIPKTTAATTYYVQIAKDASFRFKNYYIKTNGNNTQYSFRAEISANAYMSPHVTLNSQLYNAPEIKSILICKGNNYTHNIFLVIDSSTSVAKTIYIQSDNTILDTVSTTAPTTTTELTVNLITDSYIYTSKKIVANITGSAGSVSWNGITGKPSTFTPSPHIHDDRYYTETEINNKLANYLPAAGGTLTGALAAPSITASNYCMTPVMLGDDNLSAYYHRIDLGHTNVNYFDFYEYGGIYNFYQNQSTGKDKAVLLGKITSNGWEGNVIGNLSGNAATATNASKVNNHTVNSDVPSNAKFTDTVYSHPTYTAKSSGLYKVTVDGTGHVSAATAVTKADITGLGIPGSDTNTWRGIQDNLTSTSTSDSLSANQGKVLKGLIDGKSNSGHTHSTATTKASGFMSSTDKVKLDTLASGMDAYFTQEEINTIFA